MTTEIPGQNVPKGFDMLDLPAGFAKERFDEVLQIKAQANEKFKEGDYFSAKCLYAGGLEMLERCCLHVENADSTWEGIKNNMALCDLKRQEWTRVVDLTTEILVRNASNTKALYRRGVARVGQGKYSDALRDLKTVVELEPDNTDAKQKLAEVQKQLKIKRGLEQDQAEKMRGFLRGERLDDTVAVSEDGAVRKLHGNEHAPLFSSWIKREWLNQHSGVTAAVTCHIIMRTPAGKELFNTRKPPGALQQQPAGPHMVNQPKPTVRPIEPVRWVLDDAWGGVFRAWNSAVKSMQLHEMSRFEIQKHALGPSVEGAIEHTIAKWFPDTVKRREIFKDVPEDIKVQTTRRQALQILCLPEDFCMEVVTDPNTLINMEMELLDVGEYMDVEGNGVYLLQVLREGKKRTADTPIVGDLSTVTAHFRIAKLLMNYSLKDTRMGLANTGDGLVMREDRTKEPVQFIVGEEDAGGEGNWIPPCIGHLLSIPPGGVVEGMQYEMILRDGVPISDMEGNLSKAFQDGTHGFEGMADTTGPVVCRIEVEKVVPACMGPSSLEWKGME
eukprot:gnl/TRDRNA2_/TRDRNA2_125959_c1_seq1.p1 gnl/TRDRNA2_/TRDRNA2_125959_c1~~gnl/TRDRNA2_/TRDRNA2_125959_c1_seq1.p1  ORF type:complete len:557 (+),score=124.51 gnl/TRDRNA2_/TRDRNA2_125959_c1_seq1:97-1767(+)